MALRASKEMIITTRTMNFPCLLWYQSVILGSFEIKIYNYRKCLIVSKQVLEILFRIFDNYIWSQQSIEAVHENQRNILTHKYSGVQTNVLRIQET